MTKTKNERTVGLISCRMCAHYLCNLGCERKAILLSAGPHERKKDRSLCLKPKRATLCPLDRSLDSNASEFFHVRSSQENVIVHGQAVNS